MVNKIGLLSIDSRNIEQFIHELPTFGNRGVVNIELTSMPVTIINSEQYIFKMQCLKGWRMTECRDKIEGVRLNGEGCIHLLRLPK